MPQVWRGTVARNGNARVLQRGAWSGTLPASPQVNRLTDSQDGAEEGSAPSMTRKKDSAWYARPVSLATMRDRRYASFESDFLVEKLMGIDILPPIGILVSPLGLILAAYGKFANSSRYPQSLTGRPLRGANIHFTWGVDLLASGPVRLWLGWRGMRVVRQKSYSSESSGH